MPNVTSDINLIKSLLLDEMVKLVPLGAEWFSEQAVQEGETGKLLAALADSAANWVMAIKLSRRGLLLGTAIAQDLDRWGNDLALTRKPAEQDNEFRARLRKELLRSKVTKLAVRLYVEDVTGLKTIIGEPWRQQDIRDARTPGNTEPVDRAFGRSGTTHRTNHYYRGGTIDVITQDFSPLTWETTTEAIAAGIYPFFTVLVGSDPLPIAFGVDVPVRPETTVDYFNFGTIFVPVYSRSNTKYRRSGDPFNSQATDLESNTLVDDALNSHVQEPAGIHGVDLFPSIRSAWKAEKSPRSGAFRENGYPEGLEFYLYGNDVIFSAVMVNHGEVDVYSDHQSKPAAVPVMIRSVSVRSGKIAHWVADEIYSEEALAADLLGITHGQAEHHIYDLVPSERSVFSLSRSPRSGAPGEIAPLSQPFLYGGEEITELLATVSHAEVWIESGEIPFETRYSRSSHDRLRSGETYRSWNETEIEQFGWLMTQVFDRPDLPGNSSIYESPVTWEAVGEATWNEINVQGHSVQMAGELVIEIDP